MAEVVSLLASTKKIVVAAYAQPIATLRHFQFRRAFGNRSQSTAAAIPERKPATCQLVREHALIAAPPVENSSAAAKTRSRFPGIDDVDRNNL